jgi:TonB-linked SusC/RagA family outer membrane protein
MLLLSCTVTTAIAQTKSIAGTVCDQNGAPLAGATVQIEGTFTGTTTGPDGSFRINTGADKATLVFSFVGYLSATRRVDDPSLPVNVTMTEDATMLDAVVAIGYGSQSRRTVTAAISSLSSQDITGFVGSSIEQSIAGLIPGARIQTADATPGGDIDFEIRGVGTVTAGSQPLFIVDGIPIEGGVGFLNGDDVDNIQILKDAASTAVYGSRGANGVVLVTTKRGRTGKADVSVNLFSTVAQMQRKFEVMNTGDLLSYLTDSGIGARMRHITNAAQDYFPFDENLNTDWQDAISRLAFQKKAGVAISGGSDDVSYRVSAEFFDQPGVIVYTGMQRTTFRSNLDVKLSKHVKMGINLSPSLTDTRKTREGGEGSNSVIRSAIQMYPFFPVYLPDGSFFSTIEYNRAPSNGAYPNGPDPVTGMYAASDLANTPLADNSDNPIKIARDYEELSSNMRLSGGINFVFDITPRLTFRPSFSVDITSNSGTMWYPASIGKNRTDSSAEALMRNKNMWLSENMLTYDNSFCDHNLTLLAGVTLQSSTLKELDATAYRFATEAIHSLNGGIINGGYYNITPDRMLSYVGRANYNYKQKYMLQAIFRADGSSRFGPSNRFGFFPSFSGGWMVSEEKFMQPLRNVLSELKIRGSWGMSGNNNIGVFNYENKMARRSYVIDGQVISGWVPNNIGNPDLRWEKSTQTDIGIDIGLLKNRISVQADVYRSVTSDMLLNTTVPGTLGVSRMLQNVGSVENRGFEINVISRNMVGDLRWTTNFNFSMNRNKVISLGLDSEAVYDGVNDSNVTMVGKPIGMFYGRVFGGIYQSMAEIDALRNDPYSGLAFDPNVRPGDCKWFDLNGDGIYDDFDRAIIGNPHPLWNAGMVNTLSYKGFALSVQLVAQYGNQIYNYSLHQLLRGTDSNKSIMLRDRWRSEQDPGNGIADRTTKSGDVVPSADKNKFSNRLLEDGSFLSVRNAQLSYTFDSKTIRNLHLKNLTLSFNVDNIHTFTEYTGLNPESSSIRTATAPGVDRIGYPLSRNYTFAIKVNF